MRASLLDTRAALHRHAHARHAGAAQASCLHVASSADRIAGAWDVERLQHQESVMRGTIKGLTVLAAFATAVTVAYAQGGGGAAGGGAGGGTGAGAAGG